MRDPMSKHNRNRRNNPKSDLIPVPVKIAHFMDLPGVSSAPTLFVDHMKTKISNASVEINQCFFFICSKDRVWCVELPSQELTKDGLDNTIRQLVASAKPDDAKITAVVTLAESWANETPEVAARRTRGENFSLRGLSGTHDVLIIILDSPTTQGVWTNHLDGTIPNRTLTKWEESIDSRTQFHRFSNYFPESRN